MHSRTTLQWHRSDELPAWEAVVVHNGGLEDWSAGWTFQVLLKQGSTVVLDKTTGITGNTDSTVLVEWELGDLDIAMGRYRALLIGTRTSDDYEWTIEDNIAIVSR